MSNINLINLEKEDEFSNCATFWNTLLNSYEKYLINIESKINLWNENYRKLIENKNIHYKPEYMNYLSGLTILNGDWGIGKTHFVEKLLLNLCSSDNTYLKLSKKYKAIKVIDLWPYSTSDNFGLDFLNEIKNFIKDRVAETKIKKCYRKNIKKIKEWNWDQTFLVLETIYTLASQFINLPNLGENKWVKLLQKYQEYLNNLNRVGDNLMKLSSKLDKPLVIFLDNFERLGTKAINLLNILFLLSKMKNCIFVLVCNKERIKLGDLNYLESKDFIEKFINLREYKLFPNFRDFLETFFEVKNYEHSRKINGDRLYYFKGIIDDVMKLIEENKNELNVREISISCVNNDLKNESVESFIRILKPIYKGVKNRNSVFSIFEKYWELFIDESNKYIKNVDEILGLFSCFKLDNNKHTNLEVDSFIKEINDSFSKIKKSNFYKNWNNELFKHDWTKIENNVSPIANDLEYTEMPYDFVKNMNLWIDVLARKWQQWQEFNNIDKNKLNSDIVLENIDNFIMNSSILIQFILNELKWNEDNYGHSIEYFSAWMSIINDSLKYSLDQFKEKMFENFKITLDI